MPIDEKSQSSWRRPVLMWVGVAALLCAAGGAVASLTLSRHSPRAVAASTTPPSPATIPFEVLGTTPAPGAAAVPSGASLVVSLSAPLAPSSPLPTLTPPVPGSWSLLSPTTMQFVATGPMFPGTSETLTVPGGPSGLLGAQGQLLASSTTAHFTVAPGSTLRLQELLAQLGYLPVTFTPSEPVTPQQEADPQRGTFGWRWPNQPASLTSLWAPGTYGVLTRGAVMRFETQHGLPTDGQAGPQVWAALLTAAASDVLDSQPYSYVYVSTTLPESVTVYQNGAAVYHTLANTGVSAAPTTAGTYPVYLRYEVTTMSGTNPTGSHYVDPGIPWVSYFHGGDALHGFIRGSYGWPQSDGCVEMPPGNAQVVWPMTPIGTLVTVS